MALPIHFAQKLARRVFDYFHYYASNSASIVPEIMDRSYHQHRHEGYLTDQGLSDYIQEQFFGVKVSPNSTSENDEGGNVQEENVQEENGQEGIDQKRNGEGEDDATESVEQVMSGLNLDSPEDGDEGGSGYDKELTEDQEIERNEQFQVDRINSIERSPWHPNLYDKMFYL